MTIKHQVIYQHASGVQEFIVDDEIPVGKTLRVKRTFKSEDGLITYAQEGTMQVRRDVLLFTFPFCLVPYSLDKDVFTLVSSSLNTLDGKTSRTPFIEIINPLSRRELYLQKLMYPDSHPNDIISKLSWEPSLPSRSKR